MRAIVRASGYGPVRVLVPTISSRDEITAVAALLKRVRRDLASEGHEIAEHIPLGAMIEVPAAAIALPGFIDAVDFLSVEIGRAHSDLQSLMPRSYAVFCLQ